MHKSSYKKRDQFGPELVYFSNCILQDTAAEPAGIEGMADVRIIQALLEAQDTNRTKDIAEVVKLERPSEEREIHRPAVGKSHLVKAAAPSR